MTDTPPTAAPRFWERRIVRQFAKFCIVGGGSFVIDYCVRMTLLFAVPWSGGSLSDVFGGWLRDTFPTVFAYAPENWRAALPVFATISASVAILNSFFWNRRWTFRIRGREEAVRQLHRFVVISLIGLGLNVLLTTAFSSVIPGDPKNSARIATILAAGVVAFWNFTGQRFYAFKLGRK